MYLNNGVKNRRAQPIMIPVTTPDNPVFAPLSWLTADLEKEPINYIKRKYINHLYMMLTIIITMLSKIINAKLSISVNLKFKYKLHM